MRMMTEDVHTDALMPIYDKTAYLGACDLIRKFGHHAALEALQKASQHESRGERQQGCYWRRVESAIEVLQAQRPHGPLN